MAEHSSGGDETADAGASSSSNDGESNEPKFKYRRLANDMNKIFEQDAISCIAVHSKFLVLGTQCGKIYVTDHEGNVNVNRSFQCHTVAVNQVNVDRCGDYIASCSNDGKVVVYGLFCSEYSRVITMDRPIRSVSIHPEFSSPGSGQLLVTGDRVLLLHEKTFFSVHKKQLLFIGKDRDGYIHNISWKGQFIAFCNDTGIRVYDLKLKVMITHVIRRHDLTLRSELFPSSICWLDERNFVIAWANTVTVCAIVEVSVLANSNLPSRLVEIRYMWELPDYFIADVSFMPSDKAETEQYIESLPLKTKAVNNYTVWQELVLFCVSAEHSKILDSIDSAEHEAISPANQPLFPRMLLVEPFNLQEFSILNEDIISMKDCGNLFCHQFHLAGLPDEKLFYLVSTKDIVQVRPCNDDDHISWLLENRHYQKAVEYSKSHVDKLEKHTLLSVGKKYLEHLLKSEQYGEAASVCAYVCGKCRELWEYYVTKFEKIGQLQKLVDVLPVRDPQLEPESYEAVFLDLLKNDVSQFKRLVSTWSPDLFRVSALVNQILSQMSKLPQDSKNYETLLVCLAQLYVYERKLDHAVAIYLKLYDPEVFRLIDKYQMFGMMKDHMQQLLQIDADQTIRLLLENEDCLPPSTVMKQLYNQPKLQLAYLERLFARDEGSEFSDLAIHLYAKHNPSRLLPFLRDCEHYKLDLALEICRQRELIPETIFLLAKSGNRREALRLIVTKLEDIQRAINFCVVNDDDDLWTDLINFSLQKASFVTILLRNVGMHIDPMQLIRKIPKKMEIPGLRESLVKIFQDYTCQIELQEGCKQIIMKDCHENLIHFTKTIQSPVLVVYKSKCLICGEALVSRDQLEETSVKCFRCKHLFHSKCVPDELACTKCS